MAGLALDPLPVQLSEHAVPFCGPHGDVHHLDVRFLAVAPTEAAVAVSEESLEVRWWPADALPDPEADLVELVALARARLQSSALAGALEPRAGGVAVEPGLRLLGPRVTGDQRPEARVVAGLEQVGELVDEHVVDHPAGHVLEPTRQPDRAVRRRARAPAAAAGCRPTAPRSARRGRRASPGSARWRGASGRRRRDGGGPRPSRPAPPSSRPTRPPARGSSGPGSGRRSGRPRGRPRRYAGGGCERRTSTGVREAMPPTLVARADSAQARSRSRGHVLTIRSASMPAASARSQP